MTFDRKKASPLDNLRASRTSSHAHRNQAKPVTKVHTMTLPTGTGKTLLAATWALRLREQLKAGDHPPKIIVVLPYLSIIDQATEEYQKLLKGSIDPGTLLPYHSLSERVFDSEAELDDNTNDFFINTWQSDIILTTFDQLLMALMAPKARYQMRFHHLCDALIVMDEIQTLPCKLWDPVARTLHELTLLGNTHVLAMSATQPGFLHEAQELIEQPEEFFKKFGRYRLCLKHHTNCSLDDFIKELKSRAGGWTGRRVLLILNTRNSYSSVRRRPGRCWYYGLFIF